METFKTYSMKVLWLIAVLPLYIALSGCGKDDPDMSFTDARDGITYRVVTIGDQTWMAENLNYTPQVGLSWCYDDVPGLCDIRGRLYNHSAASNSCPAGWHLPSVYEWRQLSETLGGDLVSGGKLKAAGFDHWYPPNIGATNESGFSAQPFGKYSSGDYEDYGQKGYWWTSSFIGIPSFYYGVWLEYDNDEYFDSDQYDGNGYSIRCIKD